MAADRRTRDRRLALDTGEHPHNLRRRETGASEECRFEGVALQMEDDGHAGRIAYNEGLAKRLAKRRIVGTAAMAEWHLNDLEHRLVQRGWQIGYLPGDGYRYSGTWKITRGDKSFFLDFEGFDDMVTFPMEQAYGVRVRGHEGAGFYFSKRSKKARQWDRDAGRLIATLDQL